MEAGDALRVAAPRTMAVVAKAIELTFIVRKLLDVLKLQQDSIATFDRAHQSGWRDGAQIDGREPAQKLHSLINWKF